MLHLIKIASVSDPSQAALSLFSSLLYILSIKIVLIKNYYYVCLMFLLSNKLDLNQETRFTITEFVFCVPFQICPLLEPSKARCSILKHRVG